MQITTQETTTILNANSQFLAYTDGKTIYQLQPVGFGQQQKVVVGVTQQTFDELKEMTDQYYNKLVELGVINRLKLKRKRNGNERNEINRINRLCKICLLSSKI